MSNQSLFYDEISTVFWYSSKGVAHCAVTYDTPNNHIFFNILNAVTPWVDCYEPIRVRFWSLVSQLIAGIWLAVVVGRRKLYTEAALFNWILWGGAYHLDITLQARGYGLVSLATVVCFYICLIIIRGGQINLFLLVLLSTAVVLGSYSVLSFIPFAALFFLFLWMATQNFRVFVAGGVSGLSIGLLYAPVLGQIVEVREKFAEVYGRHFDYPLVVFETIHKYMPLLNIWVVLVISCWVWGVSIMLWRSPRASERILAAWASAIVLSFGLFLWLGTPFIRAVLYLGLATSFLMVVVASRWTEREKYFRYIWNLGVPLVLCVCTGWNIVHLDFVPKANYTNVIDFAEYHGPSNLKVFNDFQPWILRPLFRKPTKVTSKIDKVLFQHGQMVWVELRAPSEHFEAGFDAPTITAQALGYRGLMPRNVASNAVEIHLRQRGSFHTVVALAPYIQRNPLIKSLNTWPDSQNARHILDSLTRQDNAVTVSKLRALFKENEVYHHFELIFKEATSANMQIRVKSGDTWQEYSTHIHRFDRCVAVSLGLKAIQGIEITFEEPQELTEVWVTL